MELMGNIMMTAFIAVFVENTIFSRALGTSTLVVIARSRKNLIGFAATYDYRDFKYIIYEYTKDGFDVKAYLDLDMVLGNKYAMADVRGLFINDEFYLVSNKGLQVFDINTFLQINFIEL